MTANQTEILKSLAGNASPDKRKAGFIAALREEDHQYLLKPKDYSGSWDGCAMVFLLLSDQEIEPCLSPLLEWLQDLNWPGAEWILKRLQRVPSELLAHPLAQAVELAQSNKDDCWLANLSLLLVNPQMIRFLDPDIAAMLKPFAAEYWDWDYDLITRQLSKKHP